MNLDILIKQQKKIQNELNLYFNINDISKIRDDVHKQLNHGNGFLLFNIFLQSNKKTKECFLDLFIETAILGTENLIGISREIILTIGNSALQENKIIKKTYEIIKQIKSNDNLKYFYFRNIAQLLYELRLKVELQEFLMKHCKDSKDIDVQEVYIDYID